MGAKISNKLKGISSLDEFNTPLLITAWGDNEYGNVTHFKTNEYAEIWVENFQCFAMDQFGYLYSWGLNEYGQLGNGKFDNYVFPKYEKNYDFVNNYSIINNSKGIINEKIFKDINPIYYRKIKKISCGNGFSICLDNEGLVYSWGRGNKGELGYDLVWEESTVVSGIKCQSTPRLIERLANRKLIITDIICGSDFTFAYDDCFTPYSWGNNNHQQLARKSQHVTDSTPDKATYLIELERTLKICCGWMHGMILTEKGEVYIWGNPFYDYNNKSQDIVEPVLVELPNKAVDINCGFHHFCALVSEDGINNFDLFTWGANEYGQCGFKTQDKISYVPKRVQIHNYNIIDVICGAFHTVVHACNKKLYGFGHNFSKEIGDYSAEYIDRPVLLDFKPNEEMYIKKILCGNGFTVIAEASKEFDSSEERHRYNKIINRAEEKFLAPTTDKKVLLTGAEENVVVTTNNEKQ